MIDIETAKKLGGGNGRTTYLHPDDPKLIFKIEHAAVKGRLRWYERPPKIEPSNHREIAGHADMLVRLGRYEPWASRILGWIETTGGPALLAENAYHGLTETVTLNALCRKGTAPENCTAEDLEWVRTEYERIANIFCDRMIYNHALKPESIVFGRSEGARVLRLYDYKSIVYRQLISPRFVPRGQHNVQMLTIRAVIRKLESAAAERAAAQKERS